MSTETPHLRAVTHDDDELDGPRHVGGSGLPDFEGQPVDSTRLRLAGASGLEGGEKVNRIDDTVRLFVEGRVTRVDHVVDDKTGKLVRVHTIRVVDAVQLPWDFNTEEIG